MRTGVVATTTSALTAGWHHVAATRRGGSIALYVDGRREASASGAVNGSLANEAPVQVSLDETGPFGGQVRGYHAWDLALDPRDIEAMAATKRPQS